MSHYLIELPATEVLRRNVMEVTKFLEMRAADASMLVMGVPCLLPISGPLAINMLIPTVGSFQVRSLTSKK